MTASTKVSRPGGATDSLGKDRDALLDALKALSLAEDSPQAVYLKELCERLRKDLISEPVALTFKQISDAFESIAGDAEKMAKRIIEATLLRQWAFGTAVDHAGERAADEDLGFSLHDMLNEFANKQRKAGEKFRTAGGKHNLFTKYRGSPLWVFAWDIFPVFRECIPHKPRRRPPRGTLNQFRSVVDSLYAYAKGHPPTPGSASGVIMYAYKQGNKNYEFNAKSREIRLRLKSPDTPQSVKAALKKQLDELKESAFANHKRRYPA